MLSSISDFTIENANKCWDLLNSSIDKIYDKQASTLSYEELYRNAYYLVLHKYGDFAYKNLEEALKKLILKLFKRVVNCEQDLILKTVSECWQEGKTIINLIKDIFLYMDKNYIENKKVLSVKLLGYKLFKEIFLEEKLKNKIIEECLKLIKNEREGGRIDVINVKNIISMLIELGLYIKTSTTTYKKSTKEEVYSKKIYQSIFEKLFLEETKLFYQYESDNLIQKLTCSEYLAICSKRYSEEKQRLEDYLDIISYEAVKMVFFDNYIMKHAKILIEMEGSGLFFLLNNERIEDLKEMNFLFQFNLESYELMKQSIALYINEYFTKFLFEKSRINKKEYIEIVEEVLIFRDKMLKILEKSFLNNFEMTKLLKNSFTININKTTLINRALNIYIDYYLKTGFKNKNDEETEIVVSRIIDLFRLLIDKDFFESEYKVLLGKRLLLSNSLSKEIENNLLTKFKLECGAHYTSKIMIMFSDMHLSNEIMLEFNQGLQLMKKKNKGLLEYELEVKVITKGSWPYEEEPFDLSILPKGLQDIANQFQNFYTNKYKGRKIVFTANCGLVNIKANYESKKREFLVSPYQMCILCLFNYNSSLTLEEIIKKTRINNENELKIHIESLLEFKILIKKDDLYSVNMNFTHRNYKMEVPIIRKSIEIMPKMEESQEILFIERKHVVEACIIRIMKARKTMEHNSLTNEVLKYCSINTFVPTSVMIKQCIESLITKDYLERGNEINCYSYVS